MEITTRSFIFFLALTCIVAASSVPLGSAEETQDLAGCFSSISSVEGCIEAIDKAVSNKTYSGLGHACCEAITKLGDNCWPIVFPDQPFVPWLLKTVCKLLGKAEKVAPAPHY